MNLTKIRNCLRLDQHSRNTDVFGSSSYPEDAFTSNISFTWNMFFSRRASWPARYLWWVWKIPGIVPYSVWSGEKCFWKKKCTVIRIFSNKVYPMFQWHIEFRLQDWLKDWTLAKASQVWHRLDLRGVTGVTALHVSSFPSHPRFSVQRPHDTLSRPSSPGLPREMGPFLSHGQVDLTFEEPHNSIK